MKLSTFFRRGSFKSGDLYFAKVNGASLNGRAFQIVFEDADGDGFALEDLNGNGVQDADETDPNNPDTDGDGLSDGLERLFAYGERTGEGLPAIHPLSSDADGDGTSDADEYALWLAEYGLKPCFREEPRSPFFSPGDYEVRPECPPEISIVCGDGKVMLFEECEESSDCSSGEQCISCRCEEE